MRKHFINCIWLFIATTCFLCSCSRDSQRVEAPASNTPVNTEQRRAFLETVKEEVRELGSATNSFTQIQAAKKLRHTLDYPPGTVDSVPIIVWPLDAKKALLNWTDKTPEMESNVKTAILMHNAKESEFEPFEFKVYSPEVIDILRAGRPK